MVIISRAECQKAYQLTVSAFVDMVRSLKFFLTSALILLRFTIRAIKAALFIHQTVVAKFFLAPTG